MDNTFIPVKIDEYLAPIRAEIAQAKADIDNLTKAIQSRVDIIKEAEAEIDKLELICSKKSPRKELEEGYLYSLMSGDMYDATTSWADKKKADWLKLRNEIKQLEGKA